MSSEIKYIGLDVHKETISIAVLNGTGKLVMESIIETEAVKVARNARAKRTLTARTALREFPRKGMASSERGAFL